MRTTLSVLMLSIAMTTVIAMPAFAESAPVYDADSAVQQFDNSLEPNSDLPYPPSPDTQSTEDEENGAFVPNQMRNQNSSPNLQVESSAAHISAAPLPPPSSLPPMTPDQRLRKVEQQVNNMQSSDVAARMESLQTQVQNLRGQVEQLMHQLEQMQAQQQQMQTQQKIMYSDIDKRLAPPIIATTKPHVVSAIEPTVTSPIKPVDKTPATTPINSSDKIMTKKNSRNDNSNADDTPKAKNSNIDGPNVAEEQQIYQTAYNLIKIKKYNEAVSALQNMLQKYPTGQFAANAHYWLGELYGLMGKPDQALSEFTTVVRNHPESSRVSDAQLKVGLIYASELKWPDAKTAFKKVITRYPGTASARLASDQLKKIERAGN